MFSNTGHHDLHCLNNLVCPEPHAVIVIENNGFMSMPGVRGLSVLFSTGLCMYCAALHSTVMNPENCPLNKTTVNCAVGRMKHTSVPYLLDLCMHGALPESRMCALNLRGESQTLASCSCPASGKVILRYKHAMVSFAAVLCDSVE